MNKSLETFYEIDPQNRGISFAISRLKDIYLRNKDKITSPHRHSFYTIMFPTKAKGKHIIDFNAYDLTNNQVYFISPNQVHHVIEEEETQGYAIVFTRQYMVTNEYIYWVHSRPQLI